MKRYRPFGCEFEFSTEWDEAVPIIKSVIPKRNLRVERDYVKTENNRTWWHLKTDGSTDIELATPISKLSDLPNICRIIMKLSRDLKVTSNDGFHVHVSAKDVDVRLLMIYWSRCENAIFSLVNKQRFINDLCKKIASSFKKGMSELMKVADDHHSALSCCYYEDRKTVEFRVAEGTRDWEFIEAWVHFCVAFVDYCKKADPIKMLTEKGFRISVNKMFDDIKLPRKYVTELLARSKRINNAPKSNAPLAGKPRSSCKRLDQVRLLNGAPTYANYDYRPYYIEGL